MKIEISGPDLDTLTNALKGFDKVLNIEQENNLLIVKLADNSSSAELNNFLLTKNIPVSHLALRKKSLEKYFLELLADSND